MKNKILILDNIRSAENVGAIFRTCDAVGIEEIILSGTTPDPIDRFGRPNPKVEVEKLKKDGYQIIAIELAENSTDYKKVSPEEKVVFILGSETDGISKNILDISDIIAEIPMQGNKESLNVSVSAGIALFRILGV